MKAKESTEHQGCTPPPPDNVSVKRQTEPALIKRSFLLNDSQDSIVARAGEKLTFSLLPELLKKSGRAMNGSFGTKATAFVPLDEGQSIIAADVEPETGTISFVIPETAVSGPVSFEVLYNNELLFTNGVHLIRVCGSCRNHSICPYDAIKINDDGLCFVDKEICKGHTRTYIHDGYDDPNMAMSIQNSRVAALRLTYCNVNLPDDGSNDGVAPDCTNGPLSAELLIGEPDIAWNDNQNPFDPASTTKSNHYLYRSGDLLDAGLPYDSKVKITKLAFKVSAQPTSALPEFRIAASMQNRPENQETWHQRILMESENINYFQGYADASHSGVIYGPREVSASRFSAGEWIEFEPHAPIIWESGNDLMLEISTRNTDSTAVSGGGIFERETNDTDIPIRHAGGFSNHALAYPYSDTRSRSKIHTEDICFECFGGDEKYSIKCSQRRLQRVLSIGNCCGCCIESKTAVEGYCLPDYCPHNAISGGSTIYGGRCPRQTGGGSGSYTVNTGICTGCRICYDRVHCASLSMKAHIRRGFYNRVILKKFIISPKQDLGVELANRLLSNWLDIILLVWGTDKDESYHSKAVLKFRKVFQYNSLIDLIKRHRSQYELVAEIKNIDFVCDEDFFVEIFPIFTGTPSGPFVEALPDVLGEFDFNHIFLSRRVRIERDSDYPISKELHFDVPPWIMRSKKGNLTLHYSLEPFYSDPYYP